MEKKIYSKPFVDTFIFPADLMQEVPTLGENSGGSGFFNAPARTSAKKLYV